MPTQVKIDEVARLKETLERATSVVLASYRGLTANEMVELRARFTKQGLEYRVVKDTLARIAAREAGLEGLTEMLSGPISLALGFEDPAVAFKLSEECRKKYAPRYELRGGVFEGALVAVDQVKRYASLPSREELLAKLAMLLQSPMRALAVMLKAKIRELAVVLSEVAKKRAQEPKADSAAKDAGNVESKSDARPTPEAEAEGLAASQLEAEDEIEKASEAEPEAAAEPEEQDSEEEQEEEE
jgi:large subunit ribosomal protein L10